MTGGPVFVAGLERSGTSLMFALLATHPSISMTRRTNFWRYFADQYGDLNDDENLDACLAKMRLYKRLVKLEIDYPRLRADLVAGERSYGRLYALMEEQVAARDGKPRWGDKSLDIERYADRLVEEYPDVRMLHMMRDPRDRLASVLARWKVRRGDVGAGTAAWLWSARLARRNAERHPDNYRTVRYESLVLDPAAELESICDFIGEPYSDDMLTMSGAGHFRDQGSNSSYGARPVGSISSDSIGRFTEVLTDRQIAFIEAAAGKEMTHLGYQLHGHGMSGAEAMRFAVVDRPYHSAVMAAWRARERLHNVRGRPLPDYRLVEEPV